MGPPLAVRLSYHGNGESKLYITVYSTCTKTTSQEFSSFLCCGFLSSQTGALPAVLAAMAAILLSMTAASALAFQPIARPLHAPVSLGRAPRTPVVAAMAERAPFELKVPMPPRGTCSLKFKPLFAESEVVVVKYDVPFGLNVENQKGQCVCTKGGLGGEQEGDVLRYCPKWEIGLPGGAASPGATIASFSGAGLSWQMGLLDVAKATSWDEVVEALTSNTEERTDTVTLVFERPL